MLVFFVFLIVVVGAIAPLAWVAREREEREEREERKREYERRMAEDPDAARRTREQEVERKHRFWRHNMVSRSSIIQDRSTSSAVDYNNI